MLTEMAGHVSSIHTQWVLGQNHFSLRLDSVSWDAIEVRAVGDSSQEYQEEAGQTRGVVPDTSGVRYLERRSLVVLVTFLTHRCH
jgi:hypothetical protein